MVKFCDCSNVIADYEAGCGCGCGGVGCPVLLWPPLSCLYHLGTCDSGRSGDIFGRVSDPGEG